jgi:hypothetical protein
MSPLADAEMLEEERQRVAQLEEELVVVKELARSSAAELDQARRQLQPLWVRSPLMLRPIPCVFAVSMTRVVSRPGV